MLSYSWADERRLEQIRFRVSREDKEQLKTIGRAQGMSLSDFVRSCILVTIAEIIDHAEEKP